MVARRTPGWRVRQTGRGRVRPGAPRRRGVLRRPPAPRHVHGPATQHPLGVGRRLLEGARVCRLLGLAPGAVRDLRLPDQGAMFHIARIAGAAEALLDTAVAHGDGEAPAMYVPAYEGGHPDHDAVNLAVAVLRSRRPELVT